jgi:predicted GH43/DUF377 family glycosyl hydrolase
LPVTELPVAYNFEVVLPVPETRVPETRVPETPRRPVVVALALLLSACSHYSEFTLPEVSGGDPNTSFSFEPQKDPVLSPAEGWESQDVLNPSVVRIGAQLLNFYSGFDGQTWRTGLALSTDGVNWQRRGTFLEPSPHTWEGPYIAANGSALYHDHQFYYWYVAGDRAVPAIGLKRVPGDARGPQGLPRQESKPVLEHGPYGSWDERGVADPYVIWIEPYFYMYYLGQDRARRQRIGVARSTDGLVFEKLRSNPVLELGNIGAFDEADLGEPAVWQSHGFYWMLYTGIDASVNRKLGLARSTNGVHWTRLPAVFAGTEMWNSRVLCDPTVDTSGGVIRVWFGGGDVASRDAGLHGRIGLAILRPVNATLAK